MNTEFILLHRYVPLENKSRYENEDLEIMEMPYIPNWEREVEMIYISKNSISSIRDKCKTFFGLSEEVYKVMPKTEITMKNGHVFMVFEHINTIREKIGLEQPDKVREERFLRALVEAEQVAYERLDNEEGYGREKDVRKKYY